MPNIPPLLTHMTGDDFGNSRSGRPLFVATQNVSDGNITGGVTSLTATDGYTLITPIGQQTGNLTITNLGVLSLVAGTGISLSNTAGRYAVTISGTNNQVQPEVALKTNVPFLHNVGTTISYTNFPNQTIVPIYQVTSASAHNYCEMNFQFSPLNGNTPAFATSNDVLATFYLFVTPNLSLSFATALSNNYTSLAYPSIQNEGTTLLPSTPPAGSGTAVVPPQKITAWTNAPSSNWYLCGYNSSISALPVPYINQATTSNISVNAMLWSVSLFNP